MSNKHVKERNYETPATRILTDRASLLLGVIDRIIDEVDEISKLGYIFDRNLFEGMYILKTERLRLLDMFGNPMPGFIESKELIKEINGSEDDIEAQFAYLEELDRTIDEVSGLLETHKSNDKSQMNRARRVVSTVKSVYTPSAIALAKSKKGSLIESAKNYLINGQMRAEINVQGLEEFNLESIDYLLSHATLRDRIKARPLKNIFARVEKARKHLDKYLSRTEIKEELKEFVDAHTPSLMITKELLDNAPAALGDLYRIKLSILDEKISELDNQLRMFETYILHSDTPTTDEDELSYLRYERAGLKRQYDEVLRIFGELPESPDCLEVRLGNARKLVQNHNLR